MSQDYVTIASLFLQIQQQKEQCWKAHIRKKKSDAMLFAGELQKTTQQLSELLEDDNGRNLANQPDRNQAPPSP